MKALSTVRPLLITTAAVAATAVAGKIGTDVSSRWYKRLDKPSWQPPGAAFPVVWSALYTLIAGGGARALHRAEQEGPQARNRYLGAYGTNLALNAGWTWSFFTAQNPPLAAAEVLALEASTLDLVRRTWQLDRNAGIALLPYAAWTTFATALTVEIARRNR